MTIATPRVLVCSVVLVGALVPARPLHAQLGVGTWVRTSTDSMMPMTMTVEACCNGGRRLIYHFDINGTETILTVESRFDGRDAEVLIAGKPSGETMGMTRVDDHHTATIVKLNGKAFGTSDATLSADGKVLTVINDFSSSAGGQPVGKSTETWVRK
jgi:hypothetical protein